VLLLMLLMLLMLVLLLLLVMMLWLLVMMLLMLLSAKEWAGFGVRHGVLRVAREVLHWRRQRRRGREVGWRISLVHG
jgi:hypothetical protein